jgi:putative nucleotidyltransferase with HDIG domain
MHRANGFITAEIALLQELADNLVFGLHAIRTRQERNAMRADLNRILLQTVQAIAATLEKRDPYTAGHQQRVSELATAIATEIGLTEEQIEGVRLGAIIHDIGKIYVPAEILNRPGALSAAEFALVKSHPQVGFDIIKDVQFPWPIQEMVLQHHERLDGSGYPHGLSGADISLEARILAVADVVESINSHRPYRPSLGMGNALEEIRVGAGKLYDALVVQACLDLIARNGLPWR